MASQHENRQELLSGDQLTDLRSWKFSNHSTGIYLINHFCTTIVRLISNTVVPG
jgi:hypothetical protein